MPEAIFNMIFFTVILIKYQCDVGWQVRYILYVIQRGHRLPVWDKCNKTAFFISLNDSSLAINLKETCSGQDQMQLDFCCIFFRKQRPFDFK